MHNKVLWYFDRLFGHSSHQTMNRTDLVLVTGHFEGRIGWHFILKRKFSPIFFFSAARRTPITKLHTTKIFIHSLVLMVVPPLPTIQHIPTSNSSPLSTSCVIRSNIDNNIVDNHSRTLVVDVSLAEQFCCYVTWSPRFRTPLPSVQGHHMSQGLNSWSNTTVEDTRNRHPYVSSLVSAKPRPSRIFFFLESAKANKNAIGESFFFFLFHFEFFICIATS